MALLLVSCASVESRLENTQTLLAEGRFEATTLQSTPFPLYMATGTGQPAHTMSGPLTIVIEGDGYAWIDIHTPSANPTPKNPIGLRLAMALGPGTIYLGRPCQYVLASQCNAALWTHDRFSPGVIASYRDALDRIKATHHNSAFRLIGFSGGGYIAAVLAAQRADVVQVTTVAGVLDPEAWTTLHDIAPLASAGLDSASLRRSSQNTRFTHICAAEDDVVPCLLAERFTQDARKEGLQNHTVLTIGDEDHESLWKRAVLSITSTGKPARF
jgi:pimeloyl-ACP methyl ester carboxylesterase